MIKYKNCQLILKIAIIFSINILRTNAQAIVLSKEYNTLFTEINNELWIASVSNGFNRYDGKNVKYYTFNNSTSGLKGTAIQSPLFEDNLKRYWTSTYEYLCYFDIKDERFNCFKLSLENRIFNKGYRVFHMDEDGKTIWLRADSLLLSFDVEQQKIIQNHGVTEGNYFFKSSDRIIASPWSNAPGFEIWSKSINDTWTNNYFDLNECILSDDKVRVI